MLKENKNQEETFLINLSTEIKFKNRISSDYNGFFNYIKLNIKQILLIIICSFFYAFGQVHFLIKAAVVADGVEAISVSLAYLFPVLKPFLTVLYLALNFPLIIFFWKKVKKSFIISTLIFLYFNALFGFIIGYEPVDNFISQKVIVIMPNGWLNIANSGINSGTTNYVNASWPCFVYVILAVAFSSSAAGLVWKMGSSTGGIDLIAYYISCHYKKNVGLFLTISGVTMSTIGIIILFICKSYLPVNIAKGINGFNFILGAQTFASYLYAFLNGFVINLIYPKYKKVKLKIDTVNIEKIISYFNHIDFWHPYKIKESISGFTKNKIYTIESVVLLLESDELAFKIKRLVPDAWISISPISKIYGRFNYSKID